MAFYSRSSEAYRAAVSNAKYFNVPYVVFTDTSGNWRSHSLIRDTQLCFAVVYPDGRILKSAVEQTAAEIIAKEKA